MSRQRAILCSVVCVLMLLISGPLRLATGADYPTKPITLIVPFPPGGGADTIGRPLASVAHQHRDSQWLSSTRRAEVAPLAHNLWQTPSRMGTPCSTH